MAEFYRIKGWAKYQHYKDRNPPWIKLHRELLTSLTWALADDASRVLAIACMLLAAATDNNIPADPAYIRRVAYLNSNPDFSVLIRLEFLELVDDKGKVIITAITPLADASKLQAHARPEAETEKESEKRSTKPSARKARGAEVNNSQVARAAADTRHSRLRQMLDGWFKEWAGVECPWDGAEGRQLSALLSAWPGGSDADFFRCLEHIEKSDCIAPGTRPSKWLNDLLKFIKGPLDKFWKPIGAGNGSGNSKGDRRAADISKTTREVFGGSGIVHGNDPACLPVKAAGAGVGIVAGNAQGLLVSGVQPGDDPLDK